MKFILSIVTLVFAVSAFAQPRVITRDRGGREVVRVVVGNDRADIHALNARVRLLEQAVSNLQAQVYDLQDDQPQVRVVSVCTMTTPFEGTFIGRATSRLEAEARVRQDCENARASFCSSTRITCQETQEIIGR